MDNPLPVWLPLNAKLGAQAGLTARQAISQSRYGEMVAKKDVDGRQRR